MKENNQIQTQKALAAKISTADIFQLFFTGGRPHSTHKSNSRHWSGKWERETSVEKEVDE